MTAFITGICTFLGATILSFCALMLTVGLIIRGIEGVAFILSHLRAQRSEP